MGTLGFSYVGVLFLIMLFVPNSIWAKNQPDGYSEIAKNEKRFFVVFERVGQVMVTCCAVIFSDFNLKKISLWSLWLAAGFVLMLIYEMAWVRYFKFGHTLKNMYGKFIGIPVPLALLPVLAFLLLGVYGKSVLMIASVVILGIGHIGIHIQHYKKIK